MDRDEFIKGLEQGGRVCIDFNSLNDIPGWGELLELLPDRELYTVEAFVDLLTNYRIELTNGATIEQLSLEDAFDVTAFFMQREYSEVHQEWCDSMIDCLKINFGKDDDDSCDMKRQDDAEAGSEVMSEEEISRLLSIISGNEDGVLPAKEPSALVKTFVKLPAVQEAFYTDRSEYKSFRRRFAHLDPPWKALDIPCYSMGWRMGGGEDYMTDWFQFIEGLDSWEKELYFAHHIPPDDWKEWLEEVMRYQ